MALVTIRNILIIGFIISFTALIINAIVLSEVNNRLKRADNEFTRLNESLREQTAIGNEGENKFEDYRVMVHLAEIVPAARRADALDDADTLLQEALLFVYASANDLSITDFRRAESEVGAEATELEEHYEAAKNNSTEEKKKKQEEEEPKLSEAEIKERDEQEFDKSLKSLETGANEAGEMDYKEKLTAMAFISGKIVTVKDDNDFFVKLYPVYKILNQSYLQSVNKKQNRIKELTVERRRLADFQSYFTFGALALQMLGLGFVFVKDMLGQRRK